MKIFFPRKTFAALLVIFTAALAAATLAQAASPSAGAGSINWPTPSSSSGATLRVSLPDGSVVEQTFASGQAPTFASAKGNLADGSYTWELRAAPSGVESGAFRVKGGAIYLPDGATESPSAPADTFTSLTIQANDTSIFFDDTSTTPGFPANDWRLRANDSNNGGVDRFSIEDITGATTPFTVRGGAPSNSLYVDPIGRIGLGTSTPATNLHLVSGANPSVRLEQDTSQGGAAQTWQLTGEGAFFYLRDVTSSKFPFVVVSGAPSESLRITGDGSLGVGTSVPAGRFHVRSPGNQLSIFQSSDSMAVQFRLQTGSANRRFVALNASGIQQSQLVFGDNGAFDFLGATVSDVRMRLDASGNVGIGTTTPDQKLSVNGNASKPGGGSWATFSDERLKNIKGKYRGGLSEVLQLEPVRYEYKDDNAIGIRSPGEHIGFGAQEVQKVIPEAVTQNSNGYFMVDNDPILWTMLNAIKEQNAEIERLKKRDDKVARLEEQLQYLQAQLAHQAGAGKAPPKRDATRRNR